MLKIKLLGKNKIEYFGENLEPKLGNKTMAIIYLLISNKGRYVSRDKLTFYLWPDSTEEAAKYNLRYNIWLLKKVLPQTEDGNTLIISDKEGCILNDKYPMECDLVTIRELNYNYADIDELLCAKKLFCGNIMEGWYLKNCSGFNEFLLFDRMTLEKRHLELLKTLASKYEQEKKYSEALDILKEYATMDPENEEIALHIMKLYAQLGNRTGAISYYKSFEASLWNSLRIAPADNIKNYYEYLSNSHIVVPTVDTKSLLRGKNVEELVIRAYCMEGVDYFLISDILSKSLKKVRPDVLMKMEKGLIEDLGNINYDIVGVYENAGGEVCSLKQSIMQVRIILAFSRYMECLTEHYNIELNLEHYQDIDPISRKILEYLEDLQLKNLHIHIV